MGPHTPPPGHALTTWPAATLSQVERKTKDHRPPRSAQSSAALSVVPAPSRPRTSSSRRPTWRSCSRRRRRSAAGTAGEALASRRRVLHSRGAPPAAGGGFSTALTPGGALLTPVLSTARL